MSGLARNEFKKYKQHLHRAVCEQYGSGKIYSTPNGEPGTWRQDLPYCDEIFKFVITKTRTYFAFMEFSRDYTLLAATATQMARHLSKYIARNPEMAHLSADERLQRAREIAFDEIFTQNPYIKKLGARINKNKTERQSKKAALENATMELKTADTTKRKRCRVTKARINKFQDHYAQLVTHMEMAAFENVKKTK